MFPPRRSLPPPDVDDRKTLSGVRRMVGRASQQAPADDACPSCGARRCPSCGQLVQGDADADQPMAAEPPGGEQPLPRGPMR